MIRNNVASAPLYRRLLRRVLGSADSFLWRCFASLDFDM
jgi:hypothetical protein